MNEHKSNLPPLADVLPYLQNQGISLEWDVTSAGRFVLVADKPIPATLRHALYRYSRELTILLLLADVRICRDPERHRRAWSWLGSGSRFYCCDICYHNGLWNRHQTLPSGERLIYQQAASDAIEEVSA